MDDKFNEREAQLQYENKKLQDELNHLRDQALLLEENYNSALSDQEKHINSLKLQLNIAGRNLREKQYKLDSLEHFISNASEKIEKLTCELNSVRKELIEEKLRSEQIEELKCKEEDLKNCNAKLKKENYKLFSEVTVHSLEQSVYISTIEDLLLRIKELEEEKAELTNVTDISHVSEKEGRLKTLENLENFAKKSPEWCFSKSQLNLLSQGEGEPAPSPISKEKRNVCLREEILEAEVHEKEILIQQLECLLCKKEEEKQELLNLSRRIKEKIEESALFGEYSGAYMNPEEAFYDVYNTLTNLINSPEGQSAECKPLTEVPPLSIVVKDGVQTSQPGPIRILETISIASQTDPIKNLSPVLQFKAYENFVTKDQSPTDSDEGQSLSVLEENELCKSWQLFSEHKNCDLDMDMYRSCRKLSVLPEEENDEPFCKKSSLKNNKNLKSNSIKLKTHSADDVSKIKSNKVLIKTLKESSSFTSVFDKNRDDNIIETFRSCVKNHDRKLETSVKESNNSSGEVVSDRKLSLVIMSPRDALRQPHSFDSYLDPQQSQTSFLPRQISDPTQNTVFAPPITRRGSYIRKPRSTCRPLRLPCDKDDIKKEERICKVRFDLSGTLHKNDNSLSNLEASFPTSILNNQEKVKIVSRFRVEVIDEVEFRKSLEENNSTVTRKRPPLIHSVVYKKSYLRDLTNLRGNDEIPSNEISKMRSCSSESPDSPTYDTATEGSPAESIDVDGCLVYDPYPVKKRKHSDSSCYSIEDSQDSSEGNDILKKSIKLHTNSQCIIMKELSAESSDSSNSTLDAEIPYIDAEDLPVIKPSPDILKISSIAAILPAESQKVVVIPTSSPSDSSDIYLTPSEATPVSESNESSFGVPKSIGLSKSPTVLKNLVNFELLSAIAESTRKSVKSEIVKEEEEEEEEEEEKEIFHSPDSDNAKKEQGESAIEKSGNGSIKRTSSDISEASESDTLTYGTVKSHLVPSSDCDSDTYVTIWSDRSSTLERKFSDLSENSSSPYNTPPDTSSASFCTPPDTYSPILNLIKKYSGVSSGKSRRNSENNSGENKREDITDIAHNNFSSAAPSVHCFPCSLNQDNYSSYGRMSEGPSLTSDNKCDIKYDVMFDSPKLEFYETNDSVENLEAFLQTEEGLVDQGVKSSENPDFHSKSFEIEEEFPDSLSKRNSLESPKLSERRGKRHPPLSRQNSTEEYIFLDPHDSCLNLSEEISSPSTTPDTSNKTVIFKNIPLTVSNTIDLEDEDFPISEAEIQVNFNGSQTEIVEIPLTLEAALKKSQSDIHCRSEPCTPSISSSADFPEFSVPRKQRSSFTDESLMCARFESNLPVPPEIIVSNLSSESENSDSDVVACPGTDFASNVSDRSEVHLSDVNSISGHSDNCGSLSDHSDNVISDVFSSDSDKSSAISPEVSLNSSSPQSSDKISVQNVADDFGESEAPEINPAGSCRDWVRVSNDEETSQIHATSEVDHLESVEGSSASDEGSSGFIHEASFYFGNRDSSCLLFSLLFAFLHRAVEVLTYQICS